MADINIVLVEPQIPQNTGNIARTCAATGAALHLVKPMGFTVTDAKLKRAGLDYWDKLDITYYDCLDRFCELNREYSDAMFFFSSKAQKNYCDVSYPEKTFLVFGSETAGLPEELLYANRNKCVRIPMRDTLRCLNLSNAAAVGVYEVLRQRGFAGMREDGQLTKYTW